MIKIFYIFLVMLICSCQLNNSERTIELSKEQISVKEQVESTFSEVKTLLAIDNGKFWSHDLYGPIIIIDPTTRIFYSNENNSIESFEKVGQIYTDSLPTNINIANTAIEWEGKRWSMVMLPLPTDKTTRNNLIIHELFHRLQPDIGYDGLLESNNAHLDTYWGRLSLRLELEALDEALSSSDASSRLKHIKIAFALRMKRYTTSEIKSAENSLELNEGIAEYTALMLSGRKADKIKLHLKESKNDFYSNPTYVRSFAYQTIPMYGFLLSSIKPNWHHGIDRNTNLSDYFSQSFGVRVDSQLVDSKLVDSKLDGLGQSIEQIAERGNYNYAVINDEEIKRERIRLDKIEKLKSIFIEEPTLKLIFQNMNISFDPTNITPLGDLGTVYPNLRVTDDWGILTVEKAALLASDWSWLKVSKPTEESGQEIIGDGWKLELDSEWTLRMNEHEAILVKK